VRGATDPYESGPKVWRCQFRDLFQSYFWLALFCALLGTVPFWNLKLEARLASIGLIGCAIVFFAVQIFRLRPVSADETCIASTLAGRRWRMIPWTGVRLIEKRRVYRATLSRFHSEYVLRGDHATIVFDDNIEELPALLGRINEKIARYGIRAEFVDFGLDSRRAALARSSDRREGSSLARSGIRATIFRI